MTYKGNELRGLIPLYLIGRLPKKEKKEFEDTINKYPELKREIKEFSEIRNLYRDIEDEIPRPSETTYRRIIDNIRSEVKAPAFRRTDYLEILKSLFLSSRVLWAVVVVQVVIILFLLILPPAGDKFRTLTSKYTTQEVIKINVVFEEEAREKEIREVLNKIGATIIGGPSSEGLYIIEIKGGQDTENYLKILRDTKIVRFAERSY
jgi:hypothetical protein